MIKNKLEITEDEILCDDGIFSVKERMSYDNAEKCSHCGFELLPGEEAMEIFVNGDIIHKSCWCEYADENPELFTKDFVFSDDALII